MDFTIFANETAATKLQQRTSVHDFSATKRKQFFVNGTGFRQMTATIFPIKIPAAILQRHPLIQIPTTTLCHAIVPKQNCPKTFPSRFSSNKIAQQQSVATAFLPRLSDEKSQMKILYYIVCDISIFYLPLHRNNKCLFLMNSHKTCAHKSHTINENLRHQSDKT